MPADEQLQWTPKTLGILVAAIAVVVTVLLALFSSATGIGFASRKLTAVTYFVNASGLKPGGTVRLDGVAIGNVKTVTISTSPEHKKSPVQVVMKLDSKYQSGLHTDSPAALTTTGALGDTEIDINNKGSVGPQLRDGGELPAVNLVDSLKEGQIMLEDANRTVSRFNTVVDGIESGKGSIGKFMSDKDLMNNVAGTSKAANQIGLKLQSQNNTAGKLVNNPDVMNRLASLGKNIDGIQAQFGKVSGRPLEANIQDTQAQMRALSAAMNNGNGSVAMLMKNNSLGNQITDTVNQADTLLSKVNSKYGEGSQTSANFARLKDESNALVTKIMSNPRKYLSIDVRVF